MPSQNRLTPDEAANRYAEILNADGSKAAVAWFEQQIKPIFSAAEIDAMECAFSEMGRREQLAHRLAMKA